MFQFSWTMFFVLMLLVSAVWLAPKVLYGLLVCYNIERLYRWQSLRNNGKQSEIDDSPVFLFAAGFASGHPIAKLFSEDTQIAIIATANLLVDEHLHGRPIEEKRAYFKKQITHKNRISQWFWSQR